MAVTGPELPPDVLTLAGMGFRLFPVQERGKVPLVKGWKVCATSNPRELASWSAQHPGCNWAAATGLPSGVFALDVDGPEGSASLESLSASYGSLPETLSVATGRGKHFYFRTQAMTFVPNRVGFRLEGIDVRGDGGYTVVPPSVHQTGCVYTFINPDVPVAKPPAWLSQMLFKQRENNARTICKGNRNQSLTRLAGSLRRKGSSHEELQRALLSHNQTFCAPPLETPEVLRIAQSVARYPVGGPDVLARAWAAVAPLAYTTTYERLLALCEQLQEMRPGQPIALPLERIAEHFGCDWSLIRRYRKRAINEGFIFEVAPYEFKKKAALFRVTQRVYH